jgi:hypothetical protein
MKTVSMLTTGKNAYIRPFVCFVIYVAVLIGC